MALLKIIKLADGVWKHWSDKDGYFALTKLYAKMESEEFYIVEVYGSKRRTYAVTEIEVYDIGGTAETFANFDALQIRLKALNYIGYDASFSGGGSQNLQQTTDLGNVTTNSIIFSKFGSTLEIDCDEDAGQFKIRSSESGGKAVFNVGSLTEDRTYTFSDETGNIAMFSQIVPINGTTAGNPINGEFETPFFITKVLDNGVLQTGNVETGTYLEVQRDDTDISTFDKLVVKSANGTASKGLVGDSDFSSNYDDLSYIQKIYVDSEINSAMQNRTAANSTTTPLTLSNLNTAYPSAQRGFRVHALSILGTKVIYEKTDTGWCSYVVTIVT